MQNPIQSKVYLPHPALQPYVSAYLFTSVSSGNGSANVDLFPVGHSVISFALNEMPLVLDDIYPVHTRFNITGQLTKHHSLAISHGTYYLVYALLKPIGAFGIFRFHQSSLTDHFASMQNICGNRVDEVYEQMVTHSEHPDLVVQHLEAWFLKQLDRQVLDPKMGEIEQACTHIVRTNGQSTIKQLCEETKMSKSSLERHFSEKIGVNPKVYNRIIRFNQALKAIQTSNSANWHDIVGQYEYFDQAHFIKEFKTFFGYTPTQYHRSLLNIASHVANV